MRRVYQELSKEVVGSRQYGHCLLEKRVAMLVASSRWSGVLAKIFFELEVFFKLCLEKLGVLEKSPFESFLILNILRCSP